MNTWVTIASDPVNTVGGGWVGAGLLGAVLAWLMLVHIPAKDKMIRELIIEFRIELAEARRQGIDAHRIELNRLSTALEKAIDRAEQARAAMMEVVQKQPPNAT